ncbi:MAG: DUF3800 domain-containing protein [Dehalococcoidia bacterium]
MFLFYIEDSGDPGLKKNGSPTDAFVLSALIIKDRDWLDTLDSIVAFRRFVKNNFGIKLRDELKAGHLIHGTGSCSGLSVGARMRIYKQALRFQDKVGTLQTWAIAVDKQKWERELYPDDATAIREMAWEYMIQRIERFTTKGKDTAVIFPDEGHPKYVRKMFRKMRRYSEVPSMFDSSVSLTLPANLIVEDPNFRHSGESYFIQLADLNAYAAYRHIFPESWFGAKYWDELGKSRVTAVNLYRGGPTGMVVVP